MSVLIIIKEKATIDTVIRQLHTYINNTDEKLTPYEMEKNRFNFVVCGGEQNTIVCDL